MDIFVYSRHAIEMVRPHEVPHIIISITSSVDDRARLAASGYCVGVLRLSFLDHEQAVGGVSESDLFSELNALQIWEFVAQHKAAIQRILVHCDAGVSRSAAVAAALSKRLNGTDADFFGGRYKPNMRVYRSLVAVGELISTLPVNS